jgi:protein-L-isoaspartate(D-aspartate) O-methyltransferase
VTEVPPHRYATNVTAGIADPAVVEAFARVPRAHFVRTILDQAGQPVAATPEKIYSDEALVTRVRDGLPSSSSSQPSLMAQMLAALRLRRGHRVLEVGAGTGYNAALIAHITGAPVVSVDVQPDVVQEAVEALGRAGAAGVTVLEADGYLGAPGLGPFDRIIATVGVGGVPPPWLEQLTPGGLILAPIEHGGLQPCLSVTRSRGGLAGQGALRSGFMLAAGPLHPRAQRPQPLTIDVPSAAVPAVAVPVPALPQRLYYELWFGLAARDPRVERRMVEGFTMGLEFGFGAQCVVTDPVEGSVVVAIDGLYPAAASEALVRHVRDLVEEWHAAGAPPVSAWRCGFSYADGLWQPTGWHLTP